MKKTILILSATLLVMSCSKNEGNKSVLKEEPAAVTHSTDSATVEDEGEVQTGNNTYTYRYVAEDGTNAHVTFINDDKGSSISIKSNNKTITLPQTEVWAKGAIYKDHDIEVESKGENLKITQGNNVIELKRARGE
ncbi:MAG: hypothetical protein Q4G16_00230 [Cruoricaptor ignavus]|nr:hypothetical protein [Cruoricaptor ignavus]